MDIRLTDEQKLQQTKINAFITDLENKVKAGAATNLSLDLGSTLNGLFKTYDVTKDSKFNSNEITGLVANLRQINTEENISKLFYVNGEFNFDTTASVDVTGDGKFIAREDLVALTHILDSDAARSVAADQANSAPIQTLSTNANFGTGNVFGGLKHFNGKGAFFVTSGGFTVLTDTNVGGHTTQIYDKSGKMISRIWGDPHVDDDSGVHGDDWHFGDDSTFILPDGTEIFFNTEGNSRNNVYVTTGLYIISGSSVYQTGQAMNASGVSTAGRNAGISKLDISASEFDANYADQKSKFDGAGVFAWSQEANAGRGGWAVKTDAGEFQDIAYESWGNYLKAGNETFDNQYAGKVNVNRAQRIAALDGETVRIFDTIERSVKANTNVADSDINAQDAFLNYSLLNKANEKELTTFRNMLLEGASAERMKALDTYVKNNLGVLLNAAEEEKYLNYLMRSNDTEIASAYIDLLKLKASDNKFTLLDRLANKEFKLNEAQDDVFINMLKTFDSPKVAETYVQIANAGENPDSLALLEDYAKGEIILNPDQEKTFLNYLGNSPNANLAKTFINFVKLDPESSMLEMLEEEFKEKGFINKVVDAEVIKLFDTLKESSQFRTSSDQGMSMDKAEDLFCDYCFENDANMTELAAFTNMVSEGASNENLTALDRYITNKANLALTPAQENTYLSYLVRSDSTQLADAYLNLIKSGAYPEKLALLEDYAQKDLNLNSEKEAKFLAALQSFDKPKLIEKYLDILVSDKALERLEILEEYATSDLQLSSSQEEVFLDYLDKSPNTNLALSYLNLIEEKASPKVLKALDDLFLAKSDIKKPLSLNDLKFADQLSKLAAQKLDSEAAALYGKLIFNFNLDSPKHIFITSVLDSLDQVNATTGLDVNPAQRLSANRTILRELAAIAENPTKTIVKTGPGTDLFQGKNEFIAKFTGPYANVALGLVDAQINLLETFDQNDPKVKQAIANNIAMMDFSPTYASSNIAPVLTTTGEVRLNSRQRLLYTKFEAAHKSAHGGSPNQEENTDFIQLLTKTSLWTNRNFMDLFIGRSASGNQTAVDDLLKIANYGGSNKKMVLELPSSGISDTAINYATKFIDFAKEIPAKPAYDSIRSTAESLTNYVMTVSHRLKDANLGDFIDKSLAVLKETFPKVNSQAVSATTKLAASQGDGINEAENTRLLVRNLNNLRLSVAFGITVAPQAVDLISKGDSTALKAAGLADSNKDFAIEQISLYDSIVQIYESMISAENSKEKPDNSKISSYKNVISVYQGAKSKVKSANKL